MKFSDFDIDGLVKQAVENQVSITINIEPDHSELHIEPWKPFEYQCPYKTEDK